MRETERRDGNKNSDKARGVGEDKGERETRRKGWGERERARAMLTIFWSLIDNQIGQA